MQGLVTLTIAIVAAIVVVPILFYFVGKKTNLFKRVILSEAETVEEGYVNASGNEHLLGKPARL